MAKIVNLIKEGEKFDPVTGVAKINVTPSSVDGFGFIVPPDNNVDRYILNPLFVGGEITLETKAMNMPARKYEDGDVVARLVLLDENVKKQEQE